MGFHVKYKRPVLGTIYIVDPVGTSQFMGYVRVSRRSDGSWYVIEGLTNR